MFRPSKNLGQNFLINPGIVEKIISAADLSKKDTVLEVGPGKGVLTEELIKHAGRVIAVEKDRRLYELLANRFKGVDNLELVNADILRFNFQFPISNFQSNPKSQISNLKKYKIVANLPYNITGQFFHNFLLSENRPQMIVVMVQKEVGERILGKNKSILSVTASLYGKAEKVCDVSPGSFFPPPKVTSMVVKMVASSSAVLPPLEKGDKGGFINPPQPSFSKGGSIMRDFEMEKKVMRLARIGFASRRKKLLTNLSTGLKISKDRVKEIFNQINLNENARAEELVLSDWLKLAEKI